MLGEAGPISGGGLVPVQFEDGSYGVVHSQGGRNTQLLSDNTEPEWNELLARSTKMPTAGHGIGSDVFHIMVGEEGGDVLLKFFYNEKAWRTDTVHR